GAVPAVLTLRGADQELMPTRRLAKLRSCRRFEESLMPQPSGTRLRPGGVRMVAGADPEVVGGRRIDVQLRWNAGSLQSEVHDHDLLRAADDIVADVTEEARGGRGR